jgi:chromosome segregation ATPase
MDEAFIDLRESSGEGAGGDTFWPSFTDIMMVVVMIFMMASTVLVMRNWDLVQELRATIEAEHQAEELARSMTETSATLEEQLAQAQHINSGFRMQLMRADENKRSMQTRLSAQEQQILALTKEQQQLAASLQQSRRSGQLDADRLARLNAEHEQLTTTYAAEQERLQQALAELAGSEQTSREQAVELAGLRQDYSSSTRQLDELQGEFDDIRVKYDRLTRPARSAKGKYVVTVRYWKENGSNQLRIKDAGEEDYTVVTRKELHRRLSKLKEEQSGKLYVKLIIPDDSGLSYNEAWGFTMDILDKYDYYHQK